MTAIQPVLYIRNLKIGFPTRTEPNLVVKGIDITVHPGETVALVGESGSGKSVTARSIVGLTGVNAQVSADAFEINGQSVLQYGEREWRKLRVDSVGLVLQDAMVSLDPLRRINQLLTDASGRSRLFRRPDLTVENTALLRSVGIPDPALRLGQYPHQLSGGLRQRALIATAIARGPKLVVADEPTTALDATVQKQILDLLDARRRAGNTLLLISHDLAVVSRLADRVLVMRHGEVVEEGETARILSSPSHPYTRQLLDAVPSAQSRGYRLAPLQTASSIKLVTSGSAAVSEPARTPLPQKRIDRQRPVLVAEHLSKRYGRGALSTLVVDDASFSLAAGETLGIVGESGSGKTTVAKILLGLVRPDAGRVLIDGQPWSDLTERQRQTRRSGIQLIAQDALSSFDPRFDVERIVGESLDSIAVFGAERRRRVEEVLDAVRLSASFLKRHPRELSGGQRQRVAIARAFAPRPKLLVADEAVSALDVSVQAQVLDLLADLQAASGTALVFISHDLGVVQHLADRVIVMKHGAIVEAGEVGPLFKTPRHSYTRALLEAVPTIA